MPNGAGFPYRSRFPPHPGNPMNLFLNSGTYFARLMRVAGGMS
jgi:hypothetical protein